MYAYAHSVVQKMVLDTFPKKRQEKISKEKERHYEEVFLKAYDDEMAVLEEFLTYSASNSAMLEEVFYDHQNNARHEASWDFLKESKYMIQGQRPHYLPVCAIDGSDALHDSRSLYRSVSRSICASTRRVEELQFCCLSKAIHSLRKSDDFLGNPVHWDYLHELKGLRCSLYRYLSVNTILDRQYRGTFLDVFFLTAILGRSISITKSTKGLKYDKKLHYHVHRLHHPPEPSDKTPINIMVTLDRVPTPEQVKEKTGQPIWVALMREPKQARDAPPPFIPERIMIHLPHEIKPVHQGAWHPVDSDILPMKDVKKRLAFMEANDGKLLGHKFLPLDRNDSKFQDALNQRIARSGVRNPGNNKNAYIFILKV